MDLLAVHAVRRGNQMLRRLGRVVGALQLAADRSHAGANGEALGRGGSVGERPAERQPGRAGQPAPRSCRCRRCGST